MTLGQRLLDAHRDTVAALDDANLRTLLRELQRREGDLQWGPDWEALWWHATEEAVSRFLGDDDGDGDAPDDIVPMPAGGARLYTGTRN